METYRRGIPKRDIIVGDKAITVDSRLEEQVIRHLNANGYAGYWEKPKKGISVGKYNYTPDLEMSLSFEGMDHRALIEIKPKISYFKADISKRMRGVAPYYYTKLLLLYVDKDKQWYRIDTKTGNLSEIALPPPGSKPINKLYRPISLPGRRIYSHTYTKRFRPLMLILSMTADILEAVLVSPKTTRRRPKRRF